MLQCTDAARIRPSLLNHYPLPLAIFVFRQPALFAGGESVLAAWTGAIGGIARFRHPWHVAPVAMYFFGHAAAAASTASQQKEAAAPIWEVPGLRLHDVWVRN
jgi:hypothetical protein